MGNLLDNASVAVLSEMVQWWRSIGGSDLSRSGSVFSRTPEDGPTFILGKADADIAQGATGTISLYGASSDTHGSETDIGDNITVLARSQAISSGDWVVAVEVGVGYEAIPLAGGGGSATTARGAPGGRITASSSDPMPGSVASSTTLYYYPFAHDEIELYDGADWNVLSIGASGISLSLGSDAVGMYDLWCYDSSGTATLERLAWTNITTRATALTRQDGILAKTGDTTRRYLGSYYLDTIGTVKDLSNKRYIYNQYNQLPHSVQLGANASSWSYGTNTVREINGGSSSTHFEFVDGMGENNYDFHGWIWGVSDGTNSHVVNLAFAVNAAGLVGGTEIDPSNTTRTLMSVSRSASVPPIGLNTIYMIESGDGGGGSCTMGDGSTDRMAYHASGVLMM